MNLQPLSSVSVCFREIPWQRSPSFSYSACFPALIWTPLRPELPQTHVASVRAAEEPRAIPFTVNRNRVLVPVTVNSQRVLNLVLDTGMGFDGILLYQGDLKDSLGLGRTFEAKIPGAGGGEPSTAVVADSMTIRAGNVELRDQRIIILQSTPIRSSSSRGVMGYSLLGHYAVEIDYDRMLILLHDAESFGGDSSWHPVPLTFNARNIPFLKASIVVEEGDPIPLEMYIDFASGEALELLIRPEMKFEVPEDTKDSYLGTGLSGDIHGKMGKIARLLLGPYELKDVTTAFAPAHIRSKQKGADGILGSASLRRFNLVFDYAHDTLWIKPNSHSSEPFPEDG